MFFFFKQKTAYEMRISDWSSDVCSSDLLLYDPATPRKAVGRIPRAAIAPIWSLFAEHAAAGIVDATAAALKAAEPDDAAAILHAGMPLWAEGARVLAGGMQFVLASLPGLARVSNDRKSCV